MDRGADLRRGQSDATGFLGRQKKIKPKSLQVFSRQFATMIEAGLSVVQSLVILEQQTDDQNLGVDHRRRARAGRGRRAALRGDGRAPEHVFNRLYVAMVEAGEAAGVLDTVLDRVATQIEKEQKIKRRVRGAMIYPTVVLTFATLVLIGMLMFLVPVFVKIFDTLGGELPKLTQYVLYASNAMRGYWYIIFPRRSARSLYGFFRWKKTETGRQAWDRFKLRIPMSIGDGRPQGRDGALLAHALDADRLGRRHHEGARDHRPDLGQLGRRDRR